MFETSTPAEKKKSGMKPLFRFFILALQTLADLRGYQIGEYEQALS
jgi:hypothetical protein